MTSSYEQGRAFGGVIDVLEAVGAQYAIWGGLAVVAYGEPRFTQDMDILLQGQGLPVNLFVQRLQESHYHVDKAAVLSAIGGGFFNVIHQHWHIKTDFYLPSEPALQQALMQPVYLPFDETRRAAYLSVQEIIRAKLIAFKESGSTRHLDDVGSIVRVQGKEIDDAWVDQAAAQLGALGVWRAVWQANR